MSKDYLNKNEILTEKSKSKASHGRTEFLLNKYSMERAV
jgi:hypothetical protein